MSNVDVQYGERLLPKVVDDIARNSPDKVFATIPLTSDWRDGSRDVTYRDLSKGVDRAAWWLKENVLSRTQFETLAYTSANDLRYCFFTLGAVKADFKLLLTSPRNSVDGMSALLRNTHCQTWLTSRPAPKLISDCQAHLSISVIEIPDLTDFLDGTVEIERFPFEKAFSEAKQEPFVVLHTSGSTGLPKPVVLKHAGLACIDALRNIPPQPGFDLVQHCFVYDYDSFYVAMPAFHAAGIFMMLAMPAFSGAKVIMDSPASPMTADAVNKVHLHAKPDASLLAPSIWDDLVQNPAYLDNLRGLKGAMWGGGPLTQHTGEVLRNFARIINMYGSTEAMLLPLRVPDQEAFNYFRFYPEYGIEMQPRESGLSELVIHRKPEAERLQAIFTTFPSLSEYSLKDLFSPHPTKAGLWRYEARADDVMVLGNGEKLNPLAMEQIISSVPAVRAVLVVGHARLQTALLVEAVAPPTTLEERASLVAVIKPAIEHANQGCPGYGRLSDSMILFTVLDKPMLRAGKGTIQRQLTLDLYAEEIDQMYAATDLHTLVDLPLEDSDALSQALFDLISKTAQVDIDDYSADFFASGVDSLAALVTMKHIKAAFARRKIDTRLVSTPLFYQNSSIHKLTRKILELYRSGGRAQPDAQGDEDEREMQEMFEKYSDGLLNGQVLKQPRSSATVILTGSTGSLGSYLLHSLISDPGVRQIYCMNRNVDCKDRQVKSNANRGLTTDFNKVTFLQADFSAARIGLKRNQWDAVLSSVTHVIHNAWPVDFNLSLASFAPSLQGVRNLLDFTASAGASMLFISSISTVGNCNKRPIPEQAVKEWKSAQKLGYAQSKLVAERLCDVAASERNIDVAVARVGQVAGPVQHELGSWNQAEWLPTLIASADKMRLLPSSLGAMAAIDWIPVDELAQVLLEKALPGGNDWFHAVNPRRTSWKTMLPVVEQHLNRGNGQHTIQVSYGEWVQELENRASRDDIRENPGFRLLPFYQSLVVEDKENVDVSVEGELFSLDKSMASSQHLAHLQAVQPEWMELWMRQWGY